MHKAAVFIYLGKLLPVRHFETLPVLYHFMRGRHIRPGNDGNRRHLRVLRSCLLHEWGEPFWFMLQLYAKPSPAEA